jgi:hypothetical protein
MVDARGGIALDAAIRTKTMTLRIAVIALVASIGAFLAAPSHAAESWRGAVQSQMTDLSSQARQRPRVRVYREYQPPFWEYPRPGTYSWPGPNAKRDCRAWYVIENRPSGAVMTPRQQCWWVPG